MKKYQIIFVLIITSLYLFSVYMDSLSLNKNRKAYLKDLNIRLADINKTIFIPLDELEVTSFKDWGLRKSFLLQKREDEELKHKMLSTRNNSNLIKKIKKFKLTNRVICLEKECWEFMGIVKISNQVEVTLFSQTDNKLKTFCIGDYLLENLKIIKIKGNTMFLLNQKKNQVLKLKLFDIDISKYYPKKVQDNKGIR